MASPNEESEVGNSGPKPRPMLKKSAAIALLATTAAVVIIAIVFLRREASTESATNSVDNAEPKIVATDLRGIGLSDDKLSFKSSDIGLGDAVLSEIANIEELKTISLNGCSSVTKTGLSKLAKCSELESINLRLVSLRDEDLAFLSETPKVKNLDLSLNEELTDTSLRVISGLSQLEFLSLSGCTRISDDGLLLLRNSKNLKRINLSWCSRPSASLLRLLASELPKLKVIIIANTGHGDELLKEMAGVTSLATMDVSNCKNITEDGIKQFEKINRSCTLIR